MELYFSYLFLHYLGSLTFLAETSLTISKKLSLVYDACQKYTVLKLNISLNVISPVNLSTSVMKPTAPQNK